MGLKKIILVGYMACGKSAVGRKLHEQLNYDYYDLDNYIEINRGISVKNIFKTKGELYFRQIERKSLEKIVRMKKNLIVSLGGGTPCYFDTIDFLNSIKETKTIFLQTNINIIYKRLKKSKIKRPLISHLTEEKEIKEFVGKHLLERNYFYEKCKKKINTDNKTISAVANEIIKMLS